MNTKETMRKIRRRLDKYVHMECTHCGHEGPELLAAQERVKFLEFVEECLEKANVP
jgi:hypothetical protein